MFRKSCRDLTLLSGVVSLLFLNVLLPLAGLSKALASVGGTIIPYENSEFFDESLANAMKRGIDEIVVPVESNPTYASLVGQRKDVRVARLTEWLSEVRNSGGSVLKCEEPGESLAALIFEFVQVFVQVVKMFLADQNLYQYADDYDSVVVTSINGANVKRVYFVRKHSQSGGVMSVSTNAKDVCHKYTVLQS